MRLAILFALALVSAGCQTRVERRFDQKPLGELHRAVAAKGSSGVRFDEFEPVEWEVRGSALACRGQAVAIDNFLVGAPRLSARARAAVDALQQTTDERARFYEHLLAERRFVLTDEEQRRADELKGAFDARLDAIKQMAEGR